MRPWPVVLLAAVGATAGACGGPVAPEARAEATAARPGLVALEAVRAAAAGDWGDHFDRMTPAMQKARARAASRLAAMHLIGASLDPGQAPVVDLERLRGALRRNGRDPDEARRLSSVASPGPEEFDGAVVALASRWAQGPGPARALYADLAPVLFEVDKIALAVASEVIRGDRAHVVLRGPGDERVVDLVLIGGHWRLAAIAQRSQAPSPPAGARPPSP